MPDSLHHLLHLPLRRRHLASLGMAGAWPGLGATTTQQGDSDADFLLNRLPRRMAPALSWRDMEGRTGSLPALRGRAVLLNLWASWCAPCREEMPALHALQRHVGAQRLQVLLFNHREPPARVRAFVAQQGWDLPVVPDEAGAMARQWGVRVFPSSVLIDAQGLQVAVLVGAADWMAQLHKPWMREWLGPLPTSSG